MGAHALNSSTYREKGGPRLKLINLYCKRGAHALKPSTYNMGAHALISSTYDVKWGAHALNSSTYSVKGWPTA